MNLADVLDTQNSFTNTDMKEARKASFEGVKDKQELRYTRHQVSPKRPTNIPTRDSSCPSEGSSAHTANAQKRAITNLMGWVSAGPPWDNAVSDHGLKHESAHQQVLLCGTRPPFVYTAERQSVPTCTLRILQLTQKHKAEAPPSACHVPQWDTLSH